MSFMRKVLVGGFIAAGFVTAAHADLITLDAQGLTGPSTSPPAVAADVNLATTIGNLNLHGGAILTNTSALPADPTSVYYDSYFLGGSHTNTITLTFAQPVTNLFFYLFNGWILPDDFTVTDNAGHSFAANNVPSNFGNGVVPVLLGSVGTVVNITTTNPFYDFVIDNIQFNEGVTPPPPPFGGAPEPASWVMMLLGFAMVGSGLRRRLGASA